MAKTAVVAIPEEENLYPSGGYLPSEPQEQVNERQAEKAKVYTALPLIKEILERFDERIAFYSSVDSIPAELHTKPDEFMHAVAGNKLAQTNLLIEKNYLESLLDDVEEER